MYMNIKFRSQELRFQMLAWLINSLYGPTYIWQYTKFNQTI
jgi:hypothetical protein